MDDGGAAAFCLLSKSVPSAAGRLSAFAVRRPPCWPFSGSLFKTEPTGGFLRDYSSTCVDAMQGMVKRAASYTWPRGQEQHVMQSANASDLR